MKYPLIIITLFALSLPKLQGQETHGIYLETSNAPFFYTIFPIGLSLQYEYFPQQMGSSIGLKGGLTYVFGIDETVWGLPLKVSYPLGNEKHWFEPAVTLQPGFEKIMNISDGREFVLRKFVVTPSIDLMYRYQHKPDSWFIKAGLNPWFPPIVDVVLENTFVGDGKFDGPFVRLVIGIGAGINF